MRCLLNSRSTPPISDLLVAPSVFFGQMLKLISICLTNFSIRSSAEEADFPAKIC